MARVLVGVKSIIDYTVKICVKPDKLGVVTDGYKHSINHFDWKTIEKAVRLKKKKIAQEVIAVNCGPTQSRDIIRTALAIGADRGIHIELSGPEYQALQPTHISKMIAKLAQEEKVDLVILGNDSIDDDKNQTAQMIAGILDWPWGTFCSTVEYNNGELTITREIDGELETVKIKTPAVLSAKAKKTPIKESSLREFGIDLNA